MFSHLRLLTDLSERAHAALPIARALALACDADLCLTYASPSPEDRAEAARVLAPILDGLRAEGVRARLELVEGDVEDAASRSTGTASLLIVGHTGAGALEGLVLGSNTRRVIRHARCPVLVAGRQPYAGLHQLCCALELQGPGPVSLAAALARAAGASLRFVHVYSPETERSADELLTALEAHVGELLEPGAGGGQRVKFEVGVAESAVSGVVEAARGADLLVLGHATAPAIVRLAWGSSAESIAEAAACPVLVVPEP
ncbi:universal stress protein [Myxococcota bacterium]|nr:universal stress protein [Myxococcota bacterium]